MLGSPPSEINAGFAVKRDKCWVRRKRDIANQLIFSYNIYANISAFAQYSGKICMKD